MYYDTLIRADANTAPSPTLSQSTRLFNGTNLGLIEWTNLATAGQFPSDNTYIVLSMRCLIHVQGTNALTVVSEMLPQLFLTLTVGDKPQFSAPAWYRKCRPQV